MLSLQDIKHDKFYIDCQDNATLRECVKLLPYLEDKLQETGISINNKIIAVVGNETYFTISAILGNHKQYKSCDISEFAHLHSNWYDTVHVMD